MLLDFTKYAQEPTVSASAPEPTVLQLGSQSCRVGPHYYTASRLEAHATHMATTSVTSVASDAGSPEPIRGSSPAPGHEAEILDVSDPFLSYDAETFPYTP